MTRIGHVLSYAIAFEGAYFTDDWSRIDPFFTDDTVYQPLGAFGGPIEGRDALKAAFKMMVNGFDRRFASRAVEVVEGPTERDDSVWFRWAGTYTLPDAPTLRMIGEETVVFAGDRICRLEDRMSDEETKKVQAFLATHGAKLKPAA
jgi:hypothetical protein